MTSSIGQHASPENIDLWFVITVFGSVTSRSDVYKIYLLGRLLVVFGTKNMDFRGFLSVWSIKIVFEMHFSALEVFSRLQRR